LIWDLHHTWKVGGESPTQTWTALHEYIVHVQIKDSISRASDKHPYTYVLPGLGEAPLNELAQLLVRDGYSGGISLEWERLWHRELAHVSEALATCVGQPWFPGIRKPA
jgi:sugar phosphate isomerase/epimerase